VTVKI